VSATVWIRLALGMCFKCALGHEVSELKVHIRKVIDPALQGTLMWRHSYTCMSWKHMDTHTHTHSMASWFLEWFRFKSYFCNTLQ